MVKPRDNAGPTEQNVPMTGGCSNSQDLASETRVSQAERVCAEPQLTHSSDKKDVRSRWYRGGGPIADRWRDFPRAVYFRCSRKVRTPISAPAGSNPRARPAARPYAPGPVSGDASLPLLVRSNFGALGREMLGRETLGRDTPPLFAAALAAFSSASAAFRDAWIAASPFSSAARCSAGVSGGGGGGGGAALALVALGSLGFGGSLGALGSLGAFAAFLGAAAAASSAAMASCASLKLAYVFMVVTLLRDATAGRTAARMPGENAVAAATQDSTRTERIPIFAVEIVIWGSRGDL